jgi:hypothetical protein
LNCHYFFLLRLKITVCPGTTSCNLGGILTFTPLFLYNPLSLLHNLSPCLLSLTLCFLVDSLASWKVNRQSCERKKKMFQVNEIFVQTYRHLLFRSYSVWVVVDDVNNIFVGSKSPLCVAYDYCTLSVDRHTFSLSIIVRW